MYKQLKFFTVAYFHVGTPVPVFFLSAESTWKASTGISMKHLVFASLTASKVLKWWILVPSWSSGTRRSNVVSSRGYIRHMGQRCNTAFRYLLRDNEDEVFLISQIFSNNAMRSTFRDIALICQHSKHSGINESPTCPSIFSHLGRNVTLTFIQSNFVLGIFSALPDHLVTAG